MKTVEFCSRPPREVVNWKTRKGSRLNYRLIDLLGRSWIERYWITSARSSVGRSWIERYLAGIAKLLFIVDLFERSWIERIPVRWRIWAACCRPSRKVWNWNGLLFVSIFKSSDVTSREGRVSRNSAIRFAAWFLLRSCELKRGKYYVRANNRATSVVLCIQIKQKGLREKI